ncbi:MAG: ribonuclease P protein component [Cycloclasticus sp.]|nr:ribonuclease P protein component [Cycloclasticus sp.]MBQ0790162.1 ribonuclease P protein component [Cycloclasticus sp.]
MSLTNNKLTTSSFCKLDRLNNAADYATVFKGASRKTDLFFTILSRANNGKRPRLGLAIAKKNVKKATQRNIIKRVVRESFRRQKNDLKKQDFVVLCRNQANKANKKELADSIQAYWGKMKSDE